MQTTIPDTLLLRSLERHHRPAMLCAAAIWLGCASPALARQCEQVNWRPGYESTTGADTPPMASAVLDHDGDGVPSVLTFMRSSVNGTAFSGIARWNGASWERFGPDFRGEVYRIFLHDFDGDGSPSVTLAGFMQFNDSELRQELVEWNGSGWTVRSEVTFDDPLMRDAISVDVDGDGVATLFATRASRVSGGDTEALSRWNGAGWTPVEPARIVSLTSEGQTSGKLAAHDDDGDGNPSLYAAVHVRDGATLVARGLARFDGTTLSAVSNATNPPLIDGSIGRMLSGDLDRDGQPDLLIAGRVTSYPQPAGSSGLVMLENGSWSIPGSILIDQTPNSGDLSADIFDIAYADDDGDGVPSLFASGNIDRAGTTMLASVARFDGSEWLPVSSGLSSGAFLGALPRAKGGDDLVAFGSFATAGSVQCRGTARWDGKAWSLLGTPSSTLGVDARIIATVMFDHDDDGVASIVAGGSFRLAGTVETQGLAAFDGNGWTALPMPAGWTAGISALTVADLDGDGRSTLYAATPTGSAGSVAAYEPSASGGSWTALGGALTQRVDVLEHFDHDGDGSPSLLAAGFAAAGGAPTVLRWNGTDWIPLGSAFTGANWVHDLIAFDDDGDGASSLFAAIGRSDPYSFLNRIRRWDGSAWANVGLVTTGHAFKLQAFDLDGDGVESLVALGQFLDADGSALSFMMSLVGSSWSVTGPTTVDWYRPQAGAWLMRFDDDGDGAPSVFLSTTDPFWRTYGALSRLDGASRTILASEMGVGMVSAHETDLDGDGRRSLLLFGDFRAQPDRIGSGVAEIAPCIAPCAADLDGDGVVGSRDITVLLSAWGPCGKGGCAADLDSDGIVGSSDLSALVAAWGACP